MNAIALLFNVNQVQDSHVYIGSTNLASVAWSTLEMHCQAEDAVTRMYLLDELHTLKLRKGDTVTKHIHCFRTLIDQLSSAGVVTTDENQCLALM